MARILLCLFFGLVVLTSCSSHKNEQEPVKNGYKITVQVKSNPVAEGWVYLKKVTATGGKTVDSLQTNDEGKVVFCGKLETPGFYLINTYGKNEDFLPLYNDTVLVEVPNQGKQNTARLTGSKYVEQYSNYEIMSGKVQNRMRFLVDSLGRQASSEEEKEVKKQEFMKLEAKELANFRTAVKKYLGTVRPTFTSLYATQYFDLSTDFTFLDSLVRELKTMHSGNEYVIEFAEQLQKATRLAKGSIAPEIDLLDSNGKPFQLSSLKGKYVLLDFWASWCGPCRRNNPNLVALYNKLKSPQFEILGISLDRDKDPWFEAIKKDKLTWPQVSDLKYWNSKAAQDYEVESIPTSFLIDPKGVILGSNFSESEIQEIVMKYSK